MHNIINGILCVALVALWAVIIGKFIINMCASEKTVKAEVCDKYISDAVSKYPLSFRRGHYIVVFKTDSERLSFSVSEFSYVNYRISEKGILKYKGNKLISFGRRLK